MVHPIEIIEILGPSEQGMAKPYRCRGADGAIYYVKNRQSGSVSALAEWICSNLAKNFGLNVPPFRQVHVDEDLLRECPRDWHDLGAGIGFGSEQHALAEWVERARLGDVSEDDQRDIVVFDWWVHNMDRSLGNTNLLWSSAEHRAVVIDFNNAFDQAFDEREFLGTHVFADRLPGCFADLVVQAHYATRCSEALRLLDDACDNLPLEWQWANAEMDIPATLTLEAAGTLLSRCLNGNSWGPK